MYETYAMCSIEPSSAIAKKYNLSQKDLNDACAYQASQSVAKSAGLVAGGMGGGAAATSHNLLDLLFALLAQEKKVYDIITEFTSWRTWLDYAEYVATGDLDATLKRFRRMLTNLDRVFNARHFEDIVDERDKTMERGSLPYLLVESHSTSRRVLHPELKEFLEKVGPTQ